MAEIVFQLKLNTGQFSKTLKNLGQSISPLEVPIRLQKPKPLDISVGLKGGLLGGVIPDLKALLKTVSTDTGSAVGKAMRDVLKGTLKDILKDVLPQQGGISGLLSGLSQPFKDVITGAFQGVGQGVTLPVGQKLGEGIQVGVENALGQSIGSFQLIGEKIGENITQGILESIGIETNEILREIGESIAGRENIQIANLARQGEQANNQQQQRTVAYRQAVAITSNPATLQKFKAEEYGIAKLANTIQKRNEQLQTQIKAYQNTLGNENIEKNIERISKSIQTEITKLNQIKEQLITTDGNDTGKIAELNAEIKNSTETIKNLQIESTKYADRAEQIGNATQERFREEVSQIRESVSLYEERITALHREKQAYKDAVELQQKLATTIKNVNKATGQTTQNIAKTTQQNIQRAVDPITTQIQKVLSEMVKVIPDLQAVNLANIPTVEIGNVPGGGKASYTEATNTISLNENTAQKLLEGTIYDDIKALEYVIHELTHAFQSNFGELDRATAIATGGQAAIPFEKATAEEVQQKYKDLPERVEFSVQGYAKQFKEIYGKEASSEQIKFVRNREEDAYIRSLRAVDKVATELRKTQAKESLQLAAGSFGGRVVQKSAETNQVYQVLIQQIKAVIAKFGTSLKLPELDVALQSYKEYQGNAKELVEILRQLDTQQLDTLPVETLEEITTESEKNIRQGGEVVKKSFAKLFESVNNQLVILSNLGAIDSNSAKQTLSEINEFYNKFLESKTEEVAQQKETVASNLISKETSSAIENVETQSSTNQNIVDNFAKVRKDYQKQTQTELARQSVAAINEVDLLKKKLALQLEVPQLKQLAKKLGITQIKIPKEELINSIVNQNQTNQQIKNVERLIPQENISTKETLVNAEVLLPKIQSLTQEKLKSYFSELISDYKKEITKASKSKPDLINVATDIEKTRKLFIALSLDTRLSEEIRQYLKSKINLSSGIGGVKNQVNAAIRSVDSATNVSNRNKNQQSVTQTAQQPIIREFVAPNFPNLNLKTDLSITETIKNIESTIEALKKLGTDTSNLESLLLSITASASKFENTVENIENLIDTTNETVTATIEQISQNINSSTSVTSEDEERFRTTAFNDIINIAENINIDDRQSTQAIGNIIDGLNDYERTVNNIENRINNGNISERLFPNIEQIRTRFLSVLESIPAPIRRVAGQIGTALKGFLAFQGLNFIQNQLQGFAKESFNVSTRMESLSKSLELTSGSIGEGARNFEFIRTEAERLSQPIEQSVNSFSQLQASTKGTQLEGQQTEKIYTALSQAALVYGLSAERVGRAQAAINQISSKGVVSLEELRGQLAEALPGAIQVSARALNLTEKQLFALVSTGQLAASDFLPKLAEQLASETASGVTGASNTATAALQRFRNSITEAQLLSGKIVLPIAIATLNSLSGALKFTTDNALLLAAAIGTVSAALVLNMIPAGVTAATTIGNLLNLIRTVVGFLPAVNLSLANGGLVVASLVLGFEALNSSVLTLTGKTLKELFTGGTEFEKFAEKATKALDDIQKRIDEFNNKNNQENKPDKAPTTGFFDDLGQLASGNKTINDVAGVANSTRKRSIFDPNRIKDELTGKKQKAGEEEMPIIVDGLTASLKNALTVPTLINKTVTKLTTGKFEFYGQSQLRADQDRIRAVAAMATSNTLANQVSRFVAPGLKPTKEFEQVLNLDKQIKTLTTQRAAINVDVSDSSQALVAQQRYRALSLEISNLTTSREKASVGLEAYKQSLTGQIKDYEQQIKDTTNLEVRRQLETTLAGLTQAQSTLNQTTAKYTPPDGITAMSRMLEQLSGRYEEANRQADIFATTGKTAIAETLLKNITTDINASRTASVSQAELQVEVLKKQLEQRQVITENLVKTTNTAENQNILRESGLSTTSTINEIETRLTTTQDPKVKQVLQSYLEVRKAQLENNVIELQLQDSRKSSFDATEQSILSRIDESNQQIQSKTQELTDTRIAEIKRYQQQGILLEGEAANAVNKIQTNAAKTNLQTLQNSLIELQQNRSKINATEYTKREQAILASITTAQQQAIEQETRTSTELVTNQLKDIDAVYTQQENILAAQRATGIKSEQEYNQELLKLAETRAEDSLAQIQASRELPENQNETRQRELDNQEATILKTRSEAYASHYRDQYRLLDTSLKQAEVAIRNSEIQRQRDALNIQLKAGQKAPYGAANIDDQIQADQVRLDSRKDAIAEELKIERDRNAALRVLATRLTDPKERASVVLEIETSNEEINKLTNESIENEISQQIKSREAYNRTQDIKLSVAKSTSDQVVAGLNQEKTAQESLTRSIESQTKLLQSRKSLLEASNKASTESAQSSVNTFTQALELRRKASPATNENNKAKTQSEQAAANQELARLGLGGQSEIQIVIKKQKAENDLASAQQANQLRQLDLDAQLLALELKKEESAARRLQLEARITQLKAEQANQDARNKLEVAKQEGDVTKINEAQNTVTVSTLELQVANERVVETAKEVELQKELQKNQLDIYELGRKTTLEQINQTNATRSTAQAMERAATAGSRLSDSFSGSNFSGFLGEQPSTGRVRIGQRFKGGLVAPNTPYLVGENPDGSINPRTTEMFVPNIAGRVINARETQKLLQINQTLMPSVNRSSTITYSQIGTASSTQISNELDKKSKTQIISAIDGLHKTIDHKLSQPVAQENNFTLTQLENPSDTALLLHRRLLMQK